jgi:hypothetical protein
MLIKYFNIVNNLILRLSSNLRYFSIDLVECIFCVYYHNILHGHIRMVYARK